MMEDEDVEVKETMGVEEADMATRGADEEDGAWRVGANMQVVEEEEVADMTARVSRLWKLSVRML